jgi:hypothetical protein
VEVVEAPPDSGQQPERFGQRLRPEFRVGDVTSD